MKINQPSPSNIVTAQLADRAVTFAKTFRGICSIRNTANQTLTTGVNTAIQFNAELIDTDAAHDNVTNNTRITVPVGFTRIRLNGGASFVANATGFRSCEIRKNGAQPNGSSLTQIPVNSAAAATVLSVATGWLDTVAGDFWELYCSQNSGGALDVQTAPWTWLSAEFET